MFSIYSAKLPEAGEKSITQFMRCVIRFTYRVINFAGS